MGMLISRTLYYEKERSSGRLPVTVPIVIRGRDSNGTSFVEKTHTVLINRTGAKARTNYSLVLGAILQVAVPHLKRLSEAKVAWLGPRNSEFQEFGLGLGKPGDFWGVQCLEGVLPTVATLGGENENTGVGESDSVIHAGNEKKDANHDSVLPPAESPAFTTGMDTDKSSKISSAIQELTQIAIEQSIDEVLPRVNRQAKEKVVELQRTILEQTEGHLHRLAEEILDKLEAQATQVTAHQKKDWEQTLQGLSQDFQKRLEASLSEFQERLAASAGKVRRELARTLAGLSDTLDRD